MKMEDYKELFLDESSELLKKIETCLIELEQDVENQYLVNEIFRALHTVKGSGAMFGFTEVSEFTHLIENLFDDVRKGKLKVNATVIDIGLKSIDCVNQLLLGEDSDLLKQAILKNLEALGLLSETTEVSQSVQNIRPDSVNIDRGNDPIPRVWRIVFVPDSKILHTGARIESLFSELYEFGNCHIMAEVSNIIDLDELDPTQCYFSWTISISTGENLTKIRSIFMFVEDYANITINPVEIGETDGEVVTPKIGEILVDRGIIKADDVAEIVQHQEPFGEVALKTGKIRREHVDAALAEQNILRSTASDRENRKESSTIRVKKEKLDNLIDLVGELVILHAMLEQESRKVAIPSFSSLSESLGRLAADLRDNTMNIRMIPLEESFNNHQRLIRDLSKQLNKEIQLELSGGDTELDKNVIEELKDPLVHILRNSADHGIEAPEVRIALGKPRVGVIKLSAQQVGSRVEISIADDGQGINVHAVKARAIEKGLLSLSENDEEKIKAMIFEPGFSTAEKTTGISGRGVGMDVVRSNVEKLRGEIAVKSREGKGTSIVLSIPLTLVIIEGLQVRIEGHDYVIILSQVQECVDVEPDEARSNSSSFITLRKKTIPTVSLCESLNMKKTYSGISRAVIVNIDGNTIGLIVDEVVGRRQVVIKPLSKALRKIKIVSGATILGDGSVGLIIDTNEIVRQKISEGVLIS